MAKSSMLLRTINQSIKFHSSCRLPLLTCFRYGPQIIQNSAPICELNKRFYSSKVANLEKIYTGPAGRNIFMLKLLSLTTSLTAVILEVRLLASDVATAMKLSASFISLFTFSTPFLAHFVLRKYVTEMYYDVANDSYTAVIYTIFATRKYVNFTLADVKPLGVEILSTVRIKGRAMFFDPKHFTDVNHYKKILGYDKPLNIDVDDLHADLQKLRESKAEAKNNQNKET